MLTPRCCASRQSCRMPKYARSAPVLTAHVPLPLAEKVDEMATRLERSRGWVVKQALSAWIAQAPCCMDERVGNRGWIA